MIHNIKKKILFGMPILMMTFLFNINTTFAQNMNGNESCSFSIGTGSAYAGNYDVDIEEGGAIAYNDFENEQFVIEIQGANGQSIMLILEELKEGKHPFSMEMQVTIEMPVNEGEDFISFTNYKENGGGYIQIDKIDHENHALVGSVAGTFHEDMQPEDVTVELKGSFIVYLE